MRRGRGRPHVLLAAALVVGVASLSVAALTTSNLVALSRATDRTQSITADTLKPTECSGITLSAVVAGTGAVNGSNGNDLMLGGAGVDSLNGRAGDDCLLGGGGNDDLTGGGGVDVCIGGPGTDTFSNNCETQVQ